MKKLFANTQFAQISDYSGQLKQVIKYLIQNRNVVAPPSFLEPVYQIRPYSKTIINELFDRCVNTGYIDEFATIYPIAYRGETIGNLPDLLTMSSITIDLKNSPEATPLSGFYELNGKILANVSGLVKPGEPGRTMQISDINELHSMYVRGLLVRSYSTSNGWLSPNLTSYLTKAYCLSISGIIARNENLNIQEQLTVAMIFALYMSQMLARDDDDITKPRGFYRCTYLGSPKDLEDLAVRASTLSQNGLTIPACCELVAELGPQRLQKFNVGLFYRTCSILGPSSDPITTNVGLEYPPYFTYMLLNIFSGNKSGALLNQLKQNRLDKNEAKKFVDELRVCEGLFLNR